MLSFTQARRWEHDRPMGLNGQHAILVWDETGKLSDGLRRAALGIPLWRVSDRPKNSDLEQVDLAIVALYSRSDWAKISPLIRRTRTVIVSTTSDRSDAVRALASGAFGYLEFGLSGRALRRAVLGALHGEPAYSRAVLGDRIRTELGTSASRATRSLALTPRQREVVALIATGASDKEIGTALGIATATAQKHVTRLLKRLDVPNRAAAVAATWSRTLLWTAAAATCSGILV
ncbi:MAG TPA: response regulator transcription factor [Candidatus Limnocylindria bacterium]|nr:response regulator transcription factor [Candidatus Limnocylindria bacterium]